MPRDEVRQGDPLAISPSKRSALVVLRRLHQEHPRAPHAERNKHPPAQHESLPKKLAQLVRAAVHNIVRDRHLEHAPGPQKAREAVRLSYLHLREHEAEAVAVFLKRGDLLDFPPVPLLLPHEVALQAEPAPLPFGDRGVLAVELGPT